jgi:hypothetical protein
MINASEKLRKVRRRKALLDKETTSTDAPRLVCSDHNDEAENGPQMLVSRIGVSTSNV